MSDGPTDAGKGRQRYSRVNAHEIRTTADRAGSVPTRPASVRPQLVGGRHPNHVRPRSAGRTDRDTPPGLAAPGWRRALRRRHRLRPRWSRPRSCPAWAGWSPPFETTRNARATAGSASPVITPLTSPVVPSQVRADAGRPSDARRGPDQRPKAHSHCSTTPPQSATLSTAVAPRRLRESSWVSCTTCRSMSARRIGVIGGGGGRCRPTSRWIAGGSLSRRRKRGGENVYPRPPSRPSSPHHPSLSSHHQNPPSTPTPHPHHPNPPQSPQSHQPPSQSSPPYFQPQLLEHDCNRPVAPCWSPSVRAER
jgi:hypothetical protein